MRRQLRRLGGDGDIGIADLPAPGMYQLQRMAQQYPAVGALGLRIGVGEVPADVAQRGGTQNRVGQRVQHHVTVGMGHQATVMGDLDPAQSDVIALTKPVNVVTVTNTHGIPAELKNEGGILPCPGYRKKWLMVPERPRPTPAALVTTSSLRRDGTRRSQGTRPGGPGSTPATEVAASSLHRGGTRRSQGTRPGGPGSIRPCGLQPARCIEVELDAPRAPRPGGPGSIPAMRVAVTSDGRDGTRPSRLRSSAVRYSPAPARDAADGHR